MPEPTGKTPTAASWLDRVMVLDDLGPARLDRVRPQIRRAYVYLLPLVLVLGYLIVWPTVSTVGQSFSVGCAEAPCLDNFRAVFDDPQARHALLRTLAWAIVLPAVMVLGGFGLALALRRLRWRVVPMLLVAPMALPMIATGVSFRLMYDPADDRSLLALALTPLQLFGWSWHSPLSSGGITFALMSAFVWANLGLSTAVFRRVLSAIPAEQEAMVRAEGGSFRHVVRWVYWPVLRRVAVLLTAVTGLASARAFDLLLAMSPGASQPAGEVVALHVWRFGGGSDAGPAAALSTLWLVVLAGTVIGPLVSFRARWRMPPVDDHSKAVQGLGRSVATRSVPRRTLRLWVARVVAAAAGLLWLVPAVVLVYTALHGDAQFAVRGLLSTPLVGIDGSVLAGNLLSLVVPVVSTLLLAASVALVVTVLAGFAGHSLGWLRPPGRGLILAVVLVCATVPVQAITVPLVDALAQFRLTGSWWGLFVVHVTLGLGLTTVLLYGTFGGLSPEQMRAAQVGDPGLPSAPVRAVFRSVLPNLQAAFALQFVQVWNDLVVGLLFAPGSLAPLGVTLLGHLRYLATSTASTAALMVGYSTVPLVVMLVNRRKIERLLMGSVTGNWAADAETP